MENKALMFGKYDLAEVTVADGGLAKYIDLTPTNVPHSGGIHANRWFGKARLSIVERLINNIMSLDAFGVGGQPGDLHLEHAPLGDGSRGLDPGGRAGRGGSAGRLCGEKRSEKWESVSSARNHEKWVLLSESARHPPLRADGGLNTILARGRVFKTARRFFAKNRRVPDVRRQECFSVLF